MIKVTNYNNLIEIEGLKFYLTCPGCPEQYDVYNKDNKLVGYIRLRWGHLSCRFPNIDGDTIYSINVGDEYTGIFENEKQRMYYLKEVAGAIQNHLNEKYFHLNYYRI